jgi:hypothetical protein
MTTDGGAQWTDLTSRFHLPGARYVSKVLASRHDGRVAYVAFDGHWDDDMTPYLFKTTDGGATWTSIASDIPAWKPVKTIEEDPRNANLLFVGTEFGLYWTVDGGRHWSPATGNIPPVMVDRIIVNPRNNDLIVATHARGVFILEDIAPFEVARGADVQLFPMRSPTEVQTYRDLPWPAGNAFVAPNSPIGSYITYSIANDPPGRDSVKIDVIASNGSVVDRMVGPDAKGTHRVLWDLRYRLAYVPPASDSGFYGPPRAPYVPPGEYTIKLIARGRETTQKVTVRADPRGAGTPDGARARIAINERARDVSRVYYDILNTIAAVDSELVALRSIASQHPGTDTAITDIATQLTTLRQRARGNSITSGIGRVFDLTAAIESSSLAPTDAQQRSLAAAITEFTDITTKLDDLIATKLPALRAKAGQPSSVGPPPVKPPEL